LIKKFKYSLRTLQLTLVLYITCVSFRGPLCVKTLSMSIYISSLLRLIVIMHHKWKNINKLFDFYHCLIQAILLFIDKNSIYTKKWIEIIKTEQNYCVMTMGKRRWIYVTRSFFENLTNQHFFSGLLPTWTIQNPIFIRGNKLNFRE
jgi:hypothetical protein